MIDKMERIIQSMEEALKINCGLKIFGKSEVNLKKVTKAYNKNTKSGTKI